MNVRTKVQCVSILNNIATFALVYDPTSLVDLHNYRFTKLAPIGVDVDKFNLVLDNPDAHAHIIVGNFYYVDFTAIPTAVVAEIPTVVSIVMPTIPMTPTAAPTIIPIVPGVPYVHPMVPTVAPIPAVAPFPAFPTKLASTDVRTASGQVATVRTAVTEKKAPVKVVAKVIAKAKAKK